jgi:hypothetical protein
VPDELQITQRDVGASPLHLIKLIEQVLRGIIPPGYPPG